MKKFCSLMLTTLLVLLASFEAKAQSVADQPEKVKVTLDYTDSKAREALTMIFNVSQYSSIYERESFEVNKGDQVRFVLNTKDYDIVFNGEKIMPSDDNTTKHVVTVTEDITYTITATKREYGTTMVTLCVNELDGLVLHEGVIDGPVIDSDKIKHTGSIEYTFGSIVSRKTATLNVYSITVSSKNPKVYVSEAEDYWIEASEYPEDRDYIPAFVSTVEHPINVLAHKIIRDDKLVVYLSVDGINVTADDVILRDNNRENYPLKQGYNEFMIDADYCAEFTAMVISRSSSSPAFSYFNNRASVPMNTDTQQYVAKIGGNALLHIFAGRPTPTRYKITADFASDEASAAQILVDRFTAVTKDNPSVTTFGGCEVAVTPCGIDYTLDGESPVYDGDTHVFAVRANHSIVLKDTGAESEKYEIFVSPAADDCIEVADFKSVKIEFPGAKTVTIKEGASADEIVFKKSDNTWAAYSCTVTAVADAECPTFTITPNPLPTVGASYTYMIPEGYFIINGSEKNEDITGSFTLKQTVNIYDVPVSCEPSDNEVDINDFYGVNIFYGTEVGEYQLEPNYEKLSGMTVKLNGQELVLSEDYELEIAENILMFSFNKIEKGTLSVSVPAGAFTISGVETLAFEREWTIIDKSSTRIAAIGTNANAQIGVVTIDGRTVANDGGQNTVNSLPHGVYIINGKKFIK